MCGNLIIVFGVYTQENNPHIQEGETIKMLYQYCDQCGQIVGTPQVSSDRRVLYPETIQLLLSTEIAQISS
jgi:hypothetical protein